MTTPRTVQLPRGPVFVGGVYAVCVIGIVAVFAVQAFVSEDPYRNQGPVDSLVSVFAFGTTALVVGVGLARWLVRAPESARVGSLALLALAVLTVVFFWSGAPGILGACAAWCAGVTRDGRPLGGAARAAGVIGAFLALLNVVLSLGGLLVSAVR